MKRTSHIRCRSSLAGVGIVAVAMSSAWSQTINDESAALEEIVVTATGRTRATLGTKTDVPLIEASQSVSVITREELDVRAVYTVTEALAYTAGVQSETSGIDSRVDDVTVRGFAAGSFSNNLFVDGLRVAPGGQWTRATFDPFGLQQVEVLKGPAGVLYGQVAPGGVVNLVTKKPSPESRGEITAQAGGFTDLSHWQYQIAGDTGGSLTDDDELQGRLVGMARFGDTQIDLTENERYYIAPSLTWAPGADTSITFLGQYQRDEGGSTFQFLPATGTLYPGVEGRIDHDAYLGEPDYNTFDRDQYLAGYTLSHRFSDLFELRQNARYTHISTLYEVTVLAGDTVSVCQPQDDAGCLPGRTINRRAVRGVGETDGIAVDTQTHLQFETGALSHSLLGGIDYFRTDWEHYRDAARSVPPLLNIYDPAYSGAEPIITSLGPQIYSETVSKQVGVYLQDQIALGEFRFTLGGRHDWADDEQFDPLNNTLTLTEADEFTWRGGMTYLAENGLAPYLSYSQSFQPSTGTYFDGRPFEPSLGEQYEAGVKYQPPEVSAFITFSAYRLEQQNIATPDPDPSHICGGVQCSVQTGEARIRGLELEGKASLRSGLSLVANATYMDGEITRTNLASEQGNVLPQVPDYMVSLFADYRFLGGRLDGLGLGGGARYVGETYGDNANNLKIPSYTLFDVFARYEMDNGIALSVNARNLSNELYVANCTTVASCFYGSGRTVNLRVQYRWQ